MPVKQYTAIIIMPAGNGLKFRKITSLNRFVQFAKDNHRSFTKIYFYNKETRNLECMYTEKFGFTYGSYRK